MDELSAKWKDLTDIQRASLTELVAGKTQANVFNSLITNFSTAREALEVSANSAGSAMKENEKYLDSIAGRIEQVKASFEAFSTSVIDSGIVKAFVSIADAALKVATAFTDVAFDNVISSIATLAGGAGITAFIKNLD